MTKEKVKFFAGLSLLIFLLFVSVLGQGQVSRFEFGVLFSLTVAALVFDYRKVSQFLALTEENERAQCSHELATQTALATTLKSPLLVKLLRTELLTLYYAFFANFERSGVVSKQTQFDYAKSSNAHDVFLFVALSQLPFLPFIHAILEYKKGPGPAWVVTLLTLWSVIWFLAQVEAVKFRPIELSGDRLKYRFGLSWTAEIPIGKIKMARSVGAGEVLSGKDLFLSPMGSKKNVILEFEAPVRFSGPYLMTRQDRRAAISVDNPSAFLSQLALRGVATSQTTNL